MAGGKRKRDSIHETPDVSYITNPDVAHEHTDVPVTPLLWFVGGLVVFAVVIHIAMYGAFEFFESREIAAERKASPLARSKEESLPPEPRLQLAPGFGVTTADNRRIDLSIEAAKSGAAPAPQSEYWTVREQWNTELKEYGWADQQAGAVRLPIEQAIKMYAARQHQKGAGQTPTPAAPAEAAPAASSSGHTPEQKHQ